MAADPQKVRSIFHAAVETVDPAHWPAYLDEACGGDAELRQALEVLLRAHQQADSLLDAPPAATIDQPSIERPGTVIGPYKLLQQIGEGGFGVVYLAEQTEPVRRKVALKILKPGMDTRQIVARFEAERQALAIMDHPNIAKVFDGGSTGSEAEAERGVSCVPPRSASASSGRPYFVMELVKGIPITEYCDQNHLTPRQRLELFIPVCQAVQHAHQKGIIHRDLKPSNVLVTRHDSTAVPKVIDFGVAKALGQELTDKTLFTGIAQMIGTPLYMSPEQAGMSHLDIDTRSDIYSLGVLLYELLTGTTPFEKERFQKAAYDEIRRIIREEEPPKPSTRLSNLGTPLAPRVEADLRSEPSTLSLASVSALRQTEPTKLTKLVKGELDWIVMKALEKDRNRRYETANAFASDIQRYLADEPVQACPPSAGYRLRKFARRNQVALMTVAVICLAIVVAIGSIAWMASERKVRRVRTAAEVNQFLHQAETLYAGNKLPEAVAELHKARGLLEAADGDEDLRQRVREWLTDLDMVANLDDLCVDVGDRDRADWHADMTKLWQEYGINVEDLAPAEAAERIAARPIRADLAAALDTWSWRLRSDHIAPDLTRIQKLADIARTADPDPWRTSLRQAMGQEQGRAEALRSLASLADISTLSLPSLALLGAALGQSDAAAQVAFLRQVQRQHPSDFRINLQLGAALRQLRRPAWEESIRYCQAGVALRPSSPTAHASLGGALRGKGLSDEAIIECREAIRVRPGHPLGHIALGNVLCDSQRDYDGAIACFEDAIRLDPANAQAHNNLGNALVMKGIRLFPSQALNPARAGNALVKSGLPDRAIAEYNAAIQLKPDYYQAFNGLGNALAQKGLVEEAMAAHRESIRLRPDETLHRRMLARLLFGKGRLAEAIAEYSKAIEVDQTDTLAWLERGQAYRRAGRADEAVADFTRVIQTKPEFAMVWQERGLMYVQRRQWKEAAADFAKLVALAPNEPTYWYHHALANLGAGEQKAYEVVCTAMRERFQKTKVPAIAGRLVSTCVVGLDPPPDPEGLVALAKTAVSVNRGWNVGLLGAALYRANKPGPALECFNEKAKLNRPRPWDWLFMAMAHHRLGHGDEARACLAKAAQWIETARPGPAYASTAANTWYGWQEEVEAQVLRREVESLVQKRQEKQQIPKKD